METLDAWYRDKKCRKALNRVSLSDIPRAAKKVAQEVQALARKGRAFGSMNSLLLGYGGKMAAEAGIYLVSVSVAAVAAARKEAFANVLDEMLPAENSSPNFAPGSAFGQEAARQLTSRDYLGQFGDWLDENGTLGRVGLEAFEALRETVPSHGMGLHDAGDFTYWLQEFVMLQTPEFIDAIIDILHDYVHFRMEIDQDPAAWHRALELISEMDTGSSGVPPEFKAAFETIVHITPEQRHQAVMETPVVAGTLRLLEWIGESQPITGTGVPRRADIETIAAMIAIDAKGVAKLPEDLPLPPVELDLTQPEPPASTRHVQSAKEIRELVAWWSALAELSLIELSATKVYPGPMAEEFLDPEILDTEFAEVVLTAFVREFFLQHFTESPLEGGTVSYTMQRLTDSMTPPEERAVAAEAEDSVTARRMDSISARHLRVLESMGLVEIKNAEPHVPELLKPAILLSIVVTVINLQDMYEPS